jgi:methionyl-tRNA synthetase
LKKTDPARMESVLWTTAELVRRLALQCQPFIPGSAKKLLDLLAVPMEHREFAHVHGDYALVPGTPLPAPEGVFPRYTEQTDANA